MTDIPTFRINIKASLDDEDTAAIISTVVEAMNHSRQHTIAFIHALLVQKGHDDAARVMLETVYQTGGKGSLPN